jgi:hypothetical protein
MSIIIRFDPGGSMTKSLSAEEFRALVDAGRLSPASVAQTLGQVAISGAGGAGAGHEFTTLGSGVFRLFDSGEPTEADLESIRDAVVALADDFDDRSAWIVFHLDAFVAGAATTPELDPFAIRLALLLTIEATTRADESGNATAKLYAANTCRIVLDAAFEDGIAPFLIRECFTRYSDLWDSRLETNFDVTEHYGTYLLLSIGPLLSPANGDIADRTHDLVTLAGRGWELLDAFPEFSLLEALHRGLVQLLTVSTGAELQHEQTVRLGDIAEHLLADQRFRPLLTDDLALSLRISSSVLGTTAATSLSFLGIVGDIAATERLEREFDIDRVGDTSALDDLYDSVNALLSLEVARGVSPGDELLRSADELRDAHIVEIRDLRARVMARTREILAVTPLLADRETAAVNFGRVVMLIEPANVNVGDLREALHHLESVLHVPELPDRKIPDERLVAVLGVYAQIAAIVRRTTRHEDDLDVEHAALTRYDQWVKAHENDEFSEAALISLGSLYMLYRTDFELFGEDRDRAAAVDALERSIRMLPEGSPEISIRQEQIAVLNTLAA